MGSLSRFTIDFCSKTYILFLSKHVRQLFFLKIFVGPLSVHFQSVHRSNNSERRIELGTNTSMLSDAFSSSPLLSFHCIFDRVCDTRRCRHITYMVCYQKWQLSSHDKLFLVQAYGTLTAKVSERASSVKRSRFWVSIA